LENHQRKEHVSVDEYTIEHILPQNKDLSTEWTTMLGDDWQTVQNENLHTLGNLTLTGYNSELSDRPFSQKKTIDGGFNHSPIRLNDFLRTADTWNAEQIKKRADKLAAKANKIWFAPNLTAEQLEPYKIKEKPIGQYSVDQYEHLNGDMLVLYQALKKRIMNIDSSVNEEFKKLYIAYKSVTNFVDVVPQKSRLRLSLNMAYPDIIDPKGLCKDVSGLGRWGNGDVEIGLSNVNQLDDVMELVQQAFDKQIEAD
jgi:predicted transport protein